MWIIALFTLYSTVKQTVITSPEQTIIEAPASSTTVGTTVGTAIKYENGHIYEYDEAGSYWKRID